MSMKRATLIIVELLAAPAAAQPAEPRGSSTTPAASTDTLPSLPATPGFCDDPAVTTRLSGLVRAHRYADTHHAAVSLRVACGPRDSLTAVRLLDDIALLRLEDRPWALSDLEDLSRSKTAGADVILAWAYLSQHDDASQVLARLPAPRQAALKAVASIGDEDGFASHARGLPPELSTQALQLDAAFHDARERSPAAAGIMSALVPGAGQIYAGSFEAAAITFALNALFVGATVELALDKHYVTAAAAGTAASFFYVGGIINAVDLARRRNRVAQQPYADRIEELLVPELSGDLAH
jgi:hypothetical protein